MTGSSRTGPMAAVESALAMERRELGMAVYAAALLAACCAVILSGSPREYLLEALFWIPVIAAANLTELTTLPELELDTTLGSVVIVAAAVLFPPPAVVLFTLVGALHRRELQGRAPLVMALFNRAMHALCAGVASATVWLTYQVIDDVQWRVVPAALAAVVAFEIANTVLLAVMLAVRRGRTWRLAFAESANPFPRFALNAGVSAMLSVLLVVLVRDIGRWSIALFVIPVWLAHSAQRSAREAQDRAEQLAARVRDLEMLNGLSGELLSVHSADAVPAIAGTALKGALDGDVAVLDLDGDPPAANVRRVPIAGADHAAIVVSDDVDDQSGAVIEAVAALIGLTLTRLQVEAELAETERARTALTGRILEEATHERSRIAMSVHDDVLPMFAAAQMQIDNVDMMLEKNDWVRAQQMAETATQAVSDGIRELRDTLEALRQTTLVPGTLREGLAKLLAELQGRTGVRTTLDGPDPMPALPFAVELLAFETIRGCIANVEKHAHATTLRIELQVDEGKLVVLMRDDGRGFDPTAIGQRSHGLALMRQRAELARGSFYISGAPGAGTTVRLEVPTW